MAATIKTTISPLGELNSQSQFFELRAGAIKFTDHIGNGPKTLF
jgi:hypothetical protein